MERWTLNYFQLKGCEFQILLKLRIWLLSTNNWQYDHWRDRSAVHIWLAGKMRQMVIQEPSKWSDFIQLEGVINLMVKY